MASTSSKQLNVLIAGASIAGPSTAYWFHRHLGARVTIVERSPVLRTSGQNIDIRSVGVTVMRKIPGMEELVKARKYEVEGFQFVDDKGKVFATMRSTGDVDKQGLISEYEILRGDLAGVLRDLVGEGEGVRWVYGEMVRSLLQGEGENGVYVEFQNGLPSERFDLVVACDGASSRTRAMGFKCGPRDFVTPINAWAAFFSISRELLEKGTKMGVSHTTVGGRFFGVGPHPIEGMSKVIAMCVNPKEGTESFQGAVSEGTEALKAFVAEKYAGAGWKTGEIIEGMATSTDFYASEFVQVKPPMLYKDRVVLVGDAGYAAGPTGTGTSMAMCGAYILAGEIASHPGDMSAALEAYEERMKPIVKELQRIPPGVPGVLAPQTAWGLWMRNLAVRVVCFLMALGSRFSWLSQGLLGEWFSAAMGSGESFDVPDYEWPQ